MGLVTLSTQTRGVTWKLRGLGKLPSKPLSAQVPRGYL